MKQVNPGIQEAWDALLGRLQIKLGLGIIAGHVVAGRKGVLELTLSPDPP
jgi:hypothetical protein